MRGIARSVAFGLGLVLAVPAARAASHPPGVTYPLKPAAIQPSALAQPLPSTRRYVLVWKDQLVPDGYTAAQKQWVVQHYVGTQKLFQRQIDEYRTLNPEFMLLVYHLAYGLNGADQTNPVGNITGPNTYGQEDTDTFTPYVTAKGIARENAYQHAAMPGSVQNRVSYPDPFWLMDVASNEWDGYLADTLLKWCAFPTDEATGVFFDVAFYPWYDYSPAMWWAAANGGDGSRQGLVTFWNARAGAYFDGLRAALSPGNGHPRYFILPNVDAMVDNTDEYQFLASTDGAFTENWQAILASPGDWNLSVRRLLKYVTSAGKVWSADVTKTGTDLSQADRDLLIGTYLLARNGTSYVMFGNADLTWYPEYEIDLGGYVAEPPADLEALRVAGQGGASGGLYAREHVSGVVLVNSSAGALSYEVKSPMKRARWSGGGAIQSDGTMAAQTLAYDVDVPAGTLSVAARSVVVLRDPAGPPPPGVEPGAPPPGGEVPEDIEGGAPPPAADGGSFDAGSGGNGASGGEGGGCGCRAASAPLSGGALLAILLALSARWARRRSPR